MSNIKHLDHVNMSVRNLAESLEWYGRVFGFVRVEGGVQGGQPWAIVRAGEALLCLYQRPDLSFADRHRRPVQGMNHFGLRIRDRSAWEKTVTEENVAVLYDGPVDWPHSTAWYVQDPTGYEIEVALWDGDQVRFGGNGGR